MPTRDLRRAPIRALIFDFDGVLVESVEVKTRAFAALFAPEGPDVVREVVAFHRRNGGMPRAEKIRHYYRELLRRPLSEGRLRELSDRFEALVFEGVAAAPEVPGAAGILEVCRRGQFLGFVASGTPQDEVRRIVSRRGWEGCFAGVYGAPERKETIIRTVLGSHGLRPVETVMVGDAAADFEAARATGVSFVARATPEAPVPWADLGVRMVIEDLRALPDALRRLEASTPDR